MLDADSPAALRPQWDRKGQRRLAATAGAKNARAVQAGWGDALADAGPLNPHFNEEELRGYRCLAVLLMDAVGWAGFESGPALPQPTTSTSCCPPAHALQPQRGA